MSTTRDNDGVLRRSGGNGTPNKGGGQYAVDPKAAPAGLDLGVGLAAQPVPELDYDLILKVGGDIEGIQEAQNAYFLSHLEHKICTEYGIESAVISYEAYDDYDSYHAGVEDVKLNHTPDGEWDEWEVQNAIREAVVDYAGDNHGLINSMLGAPSTFTLEGSKERMEVAAKELRAIQGGLLSTDVVGLANQYDLKTAGYRKPTPWPQNLSKPRVEVATSANGVDYEFHFADDDGKEHCISLHHEGYQITKGKRNTDTIEGQEWEQQALQYAIERQTLMQMRINAITEGLLQDPKVAQAITDFD